VLKTYRQEFGNIINLVLYNDPTRSKDFSETKIVQKEATYLEDLC
jgi:hypothetical protein